ncbi:MAG: hypothetical protein ACHQJ6_00110 [Candidatus Berkiellales bacterium]
MDIINYLCSCSLLLYLVFFVIVLLMFKGAISNFISSLSTKSKIQYKGLSIEIGDNKETLVGATQENAKYTNLNKAFQNAIITEDEQAIRNDLVGAKLTTDQEIDVLINHLANTRWSLLMNIIDKLIFPEQVEILSKMNNQTKPWTESDLRPFFDKWKIRSENKEYSYESFVGFLIQQKLIIHGVNGYIVSLMGREYLGFCVKIGRSITFETPRHY